MEDDALFFVMDWPVRAHRNNLMSRLFPVILCVTCEGTAVSYSNVQSERHSDGSIDAATVQHLAFLEKKEQSEADIVLATEQQALGCRIKGCFGIR